MKRLWWLFRRTLSISTSVMLMYRMNIVFFLVFESLFLASQFLSVSIGYDLAGVSIAGWTRPQALLLTSVNALSHQCFLCFFIGPIFNVSVQVWNGQYDYILLKPLHPFLSMIANGQFIVSNLPNLLVCIGSVIYFSVASSIGIDAPRILIFLLMVLAGIGVRIGLALLCMAPVFFSERMADVEDSYWSVASLGRYQLEVYPQFLRLFFTFGLPLGMMASLPSRFLTQQMPLWPALVAFAVALVFVVIAGKIFLSCMRFYQSVNSGV